MEPEQRTQPKRSNKKVVDPKYLVAGRYGTEDMCNCLGPDQTIESILRVQGLVPETISEKYPGKVPPEAAAEIKKKATLEYANPEDVRKEEERTGHDVIAVTNMLTSAVEESARPHIGKYMTSADSTETAKAVRMKKAIEILIDSAENLRDVVLERSIEWKDIPHIQVTHLFDAVPETFGRAFANYAERLQFGINRLKHVYDNSIYGKWSDATGNYHAAHAVGVDGIDLEERLCSKLGINHMIASSQVPAREFLAEIECAIGLYMETVADLASHIRWLKSDDVDCMFQKKDKKGSSSMPHKDSKGGNPDKEEQAKSFANQVRGFITTMMCACEMDYGRDLTGSASDRITLDDSFKIVDEGTREIANVMYTVEPKLDRIKERIGRTYGTTTSSRVLAYLTDPELTQNPMARKAAHDLLGKLATKAYLERTPFSEVLRENKDINFRLDIDTIMTISDPMTYTAESERIIMAVYQRFHGNRTFEKGEVAKQ
ncbi:MAG: lyase family protein [Candidatus Woesearchaeota archaeon]|nr:lyase family protein [Candidatus Woesearchaeota archaeon]